MARHPLSCEDFHRYSVVGLSEEKGVADDGMHLPEVPLSDPVSPGVWGENVGGVTGIPPHEALDLAEAARLSVMPNASPREVLKGAAAS